MIKLCFTGLLLMFGLVSLAQAQMVGGKYRAEGTNFDGSRYTGTAVIDVSNANTCRIRWETGTTSTGICMVYRNVFSAAYIMENSVMGLLVYEIKPDGTLDGVWTIADTAGAGTETLTPIR